MRSTQHLAAAALASLSLFAGAHTHPTAAPNPAIQLMRAGVTPELIAASGAGPDALARFRSLCDASPAIIEDYASALRERDAAETNLRRIKSELSLRGESDELLARLSEAEATLEQRRIDAASRTGNLLDALLASSEDALDAEDFQRFERLIENRDRPVPTRYHALDMTEPQWATFESSFRNGVRLADDTLTTQQTQLLAWADVQSDVIAAHAAIEQHTQAVAVTFAASLSTD